MGQLGPEAFLEEADEVEAKEEEKKKSSDKDEPEENPDLFTLH